MELALPAKLLISLALGAAIGLEREVHERHDTNPHSAKVAFLGVRTVSLITVLGTLAGLLYKEFLGISLLIAVSYIILLMIHYIFSCMITKDIGITTELAMIGAFLVGAFIGLDVFSIQLTLAMTVILILILSNKDRIKNVVEEIDKGELRAFVAYAIIALVILPFLPNTGYSLNDIPHMTELAIGMGLPKGEWLTMEIINPSKLWLIVALITGIDVAGYLLEQSIGRNRGLLIAGLVGGFISSTATTQSLAQQSKKSAAVDQLVGIAILATTVSFFSVFILLASININFVIAVLPTFIILVVTSMVAGIFFYSKKRATTSANPLEDDEQKEMKIFALEPALKFAFLYTGIRLVTKISLALFGQNGFLIASGVSGFTGIDAASLNIADLAGNVISFDTAVFAFIIVNAVNLMAKTFYSYTQGKKEFTIKYGVSMVCIILVSLVGLFFVPKV